MKTLFIALAFVASITLVNAATTATPTENIKFPVVELGSCENAKDCYIYCERSENILKCADFGKKNGIISAEDATKAHKFLDVLKEGGPGKCKNQRTCKQYCDETSHIDECLAFAEKHEFISPKQVKEAKAVAKALQDVEKLPGGCKDKKTCEEYCSIGANWSECMEFGKKSGLVSEDTLRQIKEGFIKMPPEMKSCMVGKVGADAFNKIASGKDVTISPEIGSALQNCAANVAGALQQKMEEGLKQAPPEAQNCFKSLISSVAEKVKVGEFKGMSDIIPVALQNCLPKGTKIPSVLTGADGKIDMGILSELLKKTGYLSGKNLSPKDLEALKKAQEQFGGTISPGTETPSDQKILNLENIKRINEQMREDLKKIPPEELEQIRRVQEQSVLDGAAPQEIPESSGSGMGL